MLRLLIAVILGPSIHLLHRYVVIVLCFIVVWLFCALLLLEDSATCIHFPVLSPHSLFNALPALVVSPLLSLPSIPRLCSSAFVFCLLHFLMFTALLAFIFFLHSGSSYIWLGVSMSISSSHPLSFLSLCLCCFYLLLPWSLPFCHSRSVMFASLYRFLFIKASWCLRCPSASFDFFMSWPICSFTRCHYLFHLFYLFYSYLLRYSYLVSIFVSIC